MPLRQEGLTGRYLASRRSDLKASPLAVLQERASLLQEAYEYFRRQSAEEALLSPAAEWLLDNFHLVRETLRQIREDMPTDYYLELPKLDATQLEGYPRVYALMREAVAKADALLNIVEVQRFIHDYQGADVTSAMEVLTIGELWAIPTMLRVVLLDLLVATVAKISHLPLAEAPLPLRAIGLDTDLSDDLIVAHCIRSLRVLANQDWETFFEQVSPVDAVLREDPAGAYREMTFKSRDQYRGIVERLARRSGHSEVQVAQAVVRLAEAAADPDSETAHVGYYLLGPGVSRLEEALAYRPAAVERLGRWAMHHATPLYLAAIALITLFVAVGLTAYAAAMGGAGWAIGLTLLLALVPASMIAVNLVQAAVTSMVPPRLLPRLELDDGVPEVYKSLVVIPALLSAPDEVDFLIGQLEQHYLSHVRGTSLHLRFALLTDFADAPQAEMDEDEALLARARDGIEALNDRYRHEGAAPFLLLHRPREWNPKEGVWMGWERKRGKLMELNRLLLGGDATASGYTTQVGDVAALVGTRYVITLDADTVMPHGSAARLIGTLAHPLNRARFDPETGRVVAGYTVLQPRTEVQPTSVVATPFTRIFAGDVGLDLYTLAVSDVYQDLFGEGIYVGKGVYDVAAFHQSLEGRVPENALLSHDLFEGIHGRAALVTDIVLYEDYPPGYLTYAHRQHRWVRGDWQLLPWLLSRVPVEVEGETAPNRLSAPDRWKIFDNLRRSLRTPALLALFVAGWLLLPGSTWVWTFLALVVSVTPVLVGLLTALTRVQRQSDSGGTLSVLKSQWASLRMGIARWGLSLVFLPYEAVLMVDGIVTTLVRLLISHKRMLQWTTSAHTVRIFGRRRKVGLVWRQMMVAPLLSLVLAGLAILAVSLGVAEPGTLRVASPLLLLWFVSPQIAVWISCPARHDASELTVAQRNMLRRLARRTWYYFERYVGPDDHWLPPDHFQEDPRGLVAHRTSPTNIGLMLLSTLAAYDLGYLGSLTLLVRLRSAFDSMQSLERYRGHFLNWYETQGLSTLDPRYVSTVDSGNLAAMLLTLKEGLRELLQMPILRAERWEGLRDTLGVLSEVLADAFIDPGSAVVEEELSAGQVGRIEAAIAALQAHLAQIRRQVRSVRRAPEEAPAMLNELSTEGVQTLHRLITELLEVGVDALPLELLQGLRLWVGRLHYHLENMREEVDLLAAWLLPLQTPPMLLEGSDRDTPIGEAWRSLRSLLPAAPQLQEVPEVCDEARLALERLLAVLPADDAEPEIAEARQWSRDLLEQLGVSRQRAMSLLIGIRGLVAQAESFVDEMEFGFLYDARRHIFYLGYRVDAEELDTNHYDLLASEARTASLVAIAKGDVPVRHWLHLARPLGQVGDRSVLLSWNGSMFEYLMPELLTRSYESTLLAHSNLAVVERQIAYARERGVPWGVSESGYYRFDAAMNYQYRGFGVPGLGRKRGLAEDLVIAPYASLLAVGIAPQAVLDNMEALTALGVLGHAGFYEAIDYTTSRLPLGRKYAIVRSYMVHHQGMALLALANALRAPQTTFVDRFHRDARIRSIELLLQERIPAELSPEAGTEDLEEVPEPADRAPEEDLLPWEVTLETTLPRAHYLSNGEYGVLLTASGGGYSQWRDIAVTRWHPDTTRDAWGTWIYAQDLESGSFWSVTEQPTTVVDGRYRVADDIRVRFFPHQVAYHREVGDLAFQMDVTVASDDPVEIRRVAITNRGDAPRHLRLASYGEVVLAPQSAARRHPTFNKMFIESDYVVDRASSPALPMLLFRRRPRSSDESPPFVGHALVRGEGLTSEAVSYETDRARFLGRGGDPGSPRVLAQRDALSGTTGATLDPVMVLAQEITVPRHETVELVYLSAAGPSRQAVQDALVRYGGPAQVARAFDAARARSELELRALGLDSAALAEIQLLLSSLLYPHPAMRAGQETLAANRQGQSGLWPYAISGDYPILLLRLERQEDLALVREALRAHAYWRRRGLKIDVVLFNERDVGYEQALNEQLMRLLHRTQSDTWLGVRGGLFVINAGQLETSARTLLLASARVVLSGEAGSLAQQLDSLRQRPAWLPALYAAESGVARREVDAHDVPLAPVSRPDHLLFDNGYGGFSEDGRAYLIYLANGDHAGAERATTPAPWINVVANETFGFLVSERGGGNTWAGNSGENRLTPWHNDPVSDPPGEVLYLRDEETTEVWTPTPAPAGEDTPYLVRHEPGRTTFTHHSHGLKQTVRLFVAPDAPVKFIRLRLENVWERPRRITATYYAEWVLGVDRDTTQQYVVSEYDDDMGALLARNAYSAEFGASVAFLAADRRPHGLTADRTEFLGERGDLRHPAALGRVGLSGQVRPGLDPCAALQVHVDLEPGEMREVTFILGEGTNREAALELVRRFRDASDSVEDAALAFWDEVLDTITVETPDMAMNVGLRWALYQALSCRIWGRSAFYQSSGAFGFRDQLQDVMALLHARPDVVRAHILRAAAHQFEAGDVLHWWHPPSGRGVRTRISDDLLWLPYVTAEYVEATGDRAILEEKIPFRQGEPLDTDEEERYGHYSVTEATHTLYEHCLRAVEAGSTSGPHGLPLMGGGDWNDGMNRVGIRGRGESVWLGWFLYTALQRFARLCEVREDTEKAQVLRERAEALREALAAEAWDGDWYRRAYYDDGTPLGSARNQECRIDSIAQSWAVLSGAGEPRQAAAAMEAVNAHLVREQEGLVLLFTPPFDKTPHDPGYIKGYPPGIRENGGQYTHAALWTAWAFAELGEGDRAMALFRMLNPINHSRSRDQAERYGVEPYVIAADIYSQPPYVGRGGWTWYTGSSAWFYRLGIEAILGISREGTSLRIDPVIPQDWEGFTFTYRYGSSVYHVEVDSPKGASHGATTIALDGQTLPEQVIPLVDDGKDHGVRVVVAS